eukprot:TRINITY_DN7223_c0_g1_i1.p1 TRINITY_DN7223_c0_g1~~TRINITY_DN7223_c0_g1_i1.p1  ORF type:complete len:185 (-),score=36.92 TRINITY_DN7223_c0_g1_i1:68-622(-)
MANRWGSWLAGLFCILTLTLAGFAYNSQILSKSPKLLSQEAALADELRNEIQVLRYEIAKQGLEVPPAPPTPCPDVKIDPKLKLERQVLQHSRVWKSPIKGKPRILCYVLALSKDVAAINTVTETWGSGCDGLVFFVEKVNPALKAEQVDLKAEGDGQPGGKDKLIHKSMAAVDWLAQKRARGL